MSEFSPAGTHEIAQDYTHMRYLVLGVFRQTHHKIVILSEAPHRFIA